MKIEKWDTMGETRPMMLLLSNGVHMMAVGYSVQRIVRMAQEILESRGESALVIAVFDGSTMYEVDWDYIGD